MTIIATKPPSAATCVYRSPICIWVYVVRRTTAVNQTKAMNSGMPPPQSSQAGKPPMVSRPICATARALPMIAIVPLSR